MNWVKMAVSMKGDPSVHAIAKDCCKHDIAKAIGHLQCFFSELPAHARDGNLSAVDPMTVEQWALWTGKRGAFNEAVRKHLCSGDLLRSWDKYNGAAIRENDAARERMRLKREAEREAKNDPPPPERKGKRSPDRSPNVPRTFPSDGTGRDVTSSDDDVRAGEPRAPSSSDWVEFERVLANLPDTPHRKAIRGYALRLDPGRLPAFTAELMMLGPGGAHGARGKQATWYQVASGVADAIQKSQGPVGGTFLRSCVAKAPAEPPTPKLALVSHDLPQTIRDKDGALVWHPGMPGPRPSDDEIAANGWSVAA